jgi:DNA replication protein DnaC
MEARLKQALAVKVKTLEQFDFSFQPGIDRKVVRERKSGVRGAQ